ISGNGQFGIGLWGEDTSHNTVQGNFIGINIDGTETWGHSRDGIHSNGATQNMITDNVIGGNESAGVYLCCVLDGRNAVTSNLIGLAPSGRPLGNHIGVLIDRSHYNVVGPGNIIAHNLGDGIGFWEDTPQNTVTQNSIRDNGERGIGFSDSHRALQPPLILRWDVRTGTLAGAACADCTVEVFSDSGDEGAIYEGRVVVGSTGFYFFEVGRAFSKPRLTATTTDSAGNTSEFSLPTKGNSGNLSLQVGNGLPMLLIQTKPSSELADNRIGGNWESISSAVEAGLKWNRVIVDSSGQWQQVNWERDEYAIEPQEEQYIDDLRNNGMRIMLVLDIWEPTPKLVLKTEEGIQKYLNWVRFIARHFKSRIEYYEILNEPSFDFEAPSGMPLDVYVNLIQRTVPIIRVEDPQAKIVVGALPDTRWADVRNYMRGLLNSGVMPLVDGFSWHGMYGAAPSDDPRGIRDAGQMENYWESYPALVEEIKRVAASAGFKGEFIVEEMLWRTPTEQHESEPFGFTDISGAKYYARAIIIHLGLNVTTGLAVVPESVRPQSFSVIQALCTVMAGSQPAELPVVIESDASNIQYYGFTLSNGDRLLAVWTDGAAVEYDPGVNSTLTFPGMSAQKVIGIDVLHGFEQELITETVDDNLVIRDLLVRDYPIILQLIQ
ncbi:MAG TPA: NosD domain-containing protein, partial [Anaerolineales bacterium]|nr:NosD domain-containing protein [Anaerolineales bacterium]